jgi:hypothetical protein
MSEILLEHRSVIKFLPMKGNEPKNIHQRMINVYREFRWGRESFQDDPRGGWTINNENFKKAEILVLADRRIRVPVIDDEVGISEATVLNILHDDLGMSKISARWIPKLLNPEQKLCRQHICQLAICQQFGTFG